MLKKPLEIAQKESLLQKLSGGPPLADKPEIWVLRLDLLHPVISGNKWLKLQPWLELAYQQNLTGLVSCGGAWSNHLHAAAYACKLAGYTFTAIVKASANTQTATLGDIIDWGGKLVFCPEKNVDPELLGQQLANQNKALFVPMGGEGPNGIAGVAQFINHLHLPAFDTVICPVGTGTTYEGIAHSSLSFKTLTGINPGINDPAYETLIARLRQSFPLRKFTIEQNPALKKFGRWPTLLPQKMNEWYRAYQLPTDLVYTAKMFFCLENALLDCRIKADEKVLLIHTGGLQGNRSLNDGTLIY